MSAHHHDHNHHHDHTDPPADVVLRVKALESLLVEKALIDPAAVDRLIEAYETRIGPRNGARVVAKAWSDPAYKQMLLHDGTAAIAVLGYGGGQGEHLRVVENTRAVHNLVVCTLCSCYPWPVLGLPPVWYKSAPYRARAVADPRGVLKEFGADLPENVEIRVWDSTSEVRCLVLPERPAGTDGWSEDQLAGLVTRNAMIGVEKAGPPSPSPLAGEGGVPTSPSPLAGEGGAPTSPSPLAGKGGAPTSPSPWRGRAGRLLLPPPGGEGRGAYFSLPLAGEGRGGVES